MKKYILTICILLTFGFVSAHQPRLIFDKFAGQMINIKNPEISQAFYGILSGQENVFRIIAKTGFLLYVNIVVPDISGHRTDFVVDIVGSNKTISTKLDGQGFAWTGFWEPFAGDEYLQGPSIEKKVGPGLYSIRVSNPDNKGKYSLAIGKTESFPLNEIIHTYKVLPELKMTYFQKPRYTILRNYVGLFIFGGIIIGILMVIGGVKLVRYIRNNKSSGHIDENRYK